MFHQNCSRGTSLKSRVCQPHSGARRKVKGSPKSDECVVWEQRMPVSNFVPMRQINVEIFHLMLVVLNEMPTMTITHKGFLSRTKYWTDRLLPGGYKTQRDDSWTTNRKSAPVFTWLVMPAGAEVEGGLGALQSHLSPVRDSLQLHSVAAVLLKPLQIHPALRLRRQETLVGISMLPHSHWRPPFKAPSLSQP